jgi:hypothetical protein
MRKAIVSLIVLAVSAGALGADERAPRVTVGLNLAQMAWNSIAGAAIRVTWVPIPLKASVRLSELVGLSAGIHYRYENYWEGKGLWRDYHEVFIMTGPRVSFTRSGLRGWYASAQLGFGYAADPSPYRCWSFVAQPKVGYSFVWRTRIHLALGLGLLINVPVDEENGVALSTIGYLAHRFIPLLDASLGFAL